MKKILVIDDEPHSVSTLTTRLEANNYEVIMAEDGVEALKKVREEDPDLIILDILMPVMDGYTFVRELKKAPREIPIIVLTAKGGLTDLFAGEGIKDYIVKPFEADELLKKIDKYLK